MKWQKSIFHTFGAGLRDHIKFVSPGGHFEAVFNRLGQHVTGLANIATYNFVSPNKYGGVGHFFADVVPYYIWGNAPEDPTTWYQRIGRVRVLIQ